MANQPFSNYNHNGTFLGSFGTKRAAFEDAVEYVMQTENACTLKANGKQYMYIDMDYINKVLAS